MKYLKIIFVIFFIVFVYVVYFKYTRKVSNEFDLCGCEKYLANEYIKKGELYPRYIGLNTNYLLFKKYGLFVSKLQKCGQEIMDKAIYQKFGNDFYKNLQILEDSLSEENIIFNIDGINKRKIDAFPVYPIYEDFFKFILDSLIKLKFKPIPDNACLPYSYELYFVVTKEGKTKDFIVGNKINPKFDHTVISIIKNLPLKWQPATINSQKVDYRINLRLDYNQSFIKTIYSDEPVFLD